MYLLRIFQPNPPRSSLLTIYKTFNRSPLDYADVIYNQAYNSSFHEKTRISRIQCFFGNNRTNKRNIIRKTIPRVRVRISSIRDIGLKNVGFKRWFKKLY